MTNEKKGSIESINQIYDLVDNKENKDLDIQKDQTIQIYYNHGIEEILPMTHSCGSSELKPCGMCFNCKERIWAYNKLNKSLELGL